ncbi:ExbD/TolR family protein [Fulvivirga sedimenti]|uniref:Biopolymer transporter ExbD n=1 Tax=Fulvivirga sedimenti TaxID=2879465 RepID=A0A9X1HNP5_9BACT|nr:biopolymer transporter ExbD [Fulvivirga sedimenti]MCA6073327.1 biopolymer transporter ExbD [Fulvivirga sedimenti]
MALKSKHNVEPMFSMSSMTDIIFLLLIFFMLTSSFITPSGLPVNLPTSRASTVEMQKVSVTITENMEYFVGDKKVSKNMLEAELRSRLTEGQGSVVLHIDKSVPTEQFVYVAGIATSLEAKVSIATLPE